jgi:hypothetical protein
LYWSKTDSWTRVSAYQNDLQVDGSVRLFVQGKLRSGDVLPLRLRVKDAAITEVTLNVAGQDPVPLSLQTQPKGQEADFEFTVRDGANPVTITMPDGSKLTWQLGRPVF